MRRWKLSVGIENFQEIRQAGFYYVDKTRLMNSFLSSGEGSCVISLIEECRRVYI